VRQLATSQQQDVGQACGGPKVDIVEIGRGAEGSRNGPEVAPADALALTPLASRVLAASQ